MQRYVTLGSSWVRLRKSEAWSGVVPQQLYLRKELKRMGKRMDDSISRQAAIDAILSCTNCKSVRELYEYTQEHDLSNMWEGGIVDAIDMVIGVPTAEPESQWMPLPEPKKEGADE